MDNVIRYISEFSLSEFVVSFFILLFCFRQMGDLLIWAQSKLGIETKTIRKIKSDREMLEKHEALLDNVMKALETMGKKIDNISDKTVMIEKEQDLRRMRELRKNILSFNHAMYKQNYSREMCEEIFDDYEEYENLLIKWNEKNGRTTRAMDEINEYYKNL